MTKVSREPVKSRRSCKVEAPGGSPAGQPVEPDLEVLIEIARMKMPFGRYAGRRLIDLPEPYIVWFRNKGYPKGRLGMLLATLYEIKANGLEVLLAPLRDPADPRYRRTPEMHFREGDP